MDTGNFLQIVITVIAIIGAAAVALVCDMLKTNNERLREANLELRVRREEEQRRTELAIDQLKRISPAAAERVLNASHPATLPQPVSALLSPAPEAAAISGLPALTEETAGVPEPVKPGATIGEARQLARDFLGGRSSAERSPVAVSAHDSPAATTPVAVTEQPMRPPRKNWDQLLKGGTRRATIDVTPVPALGKPKGALIPFESFHAVQGLHAQAGEAENLRLPSGFHGMGELSQLLDVCKPLRGLVVSVGLNVAASGESGAPAIPAGTLRGAAGEFVRSLLEPGEFACQSAIDQFLIVSACSAEASQRRLTEITEKLWDFQLRTDLPLGMVLSWGGYESNGEALSNAITSAVQRMEENRRSRTAAGAAGLARHRRAV